MKYILALDAGTTSSRALLFNSHLEIVGMAQKEFTQIYPQPGWVEHNPAEIWETQLEVAQRVISEQNISPSEIASIGITNQRETTVVWNKETGEPIYNAIVWQDRRTAATIEELKSEGLTDHIQKTTGLIPDAYFSGTKIHWILNHVEAAQGLAEQGLLAFGTVDSWILWKLTEGREHATDYSNISRSMIYDINALDWDDSLLKRLNIPRALLPEVKNSSDDYGSTALLGDSIRITGIAGDQQSALFGQRCWTKGDAKNTYGTGCFMLMHTGDTRILSENGLLSTIAWGIDGKVEYALEGSVFIAGAAMQWLRDELNVLDDAAESEQIANTVEDTGGVYMVPAFAGLGAPHWDPYARGAILGLTRGTGRAHIIRAALESMAFQTADVLNAMEADSGTTLSRLKVDGGASANAFLMQFQADILNTEVIRPSSVESTALGAALLAGLNVGFYKKEDILSSSSPSIAISSKESFRPIQNDAWRAEKIKGWNEAVSRVKSQNTDSI